MPLDLDFAGVERPSFTPIPEDDYDLICEDCELKPGKTNEKDVMAHMIFTVDGGDYDGRRVLHFQSLLTPEGKKYAKVMLESLYGYEVNDNFTFDEDDIVGRSCTAHVTVVPDARDATKKQNRISYFKIPFAVNDEATSTITYNGEEPF